MNQVGLFLHNFYKLFQQNNSPVILVTAHRARNATFTLKYTRRNICRHWNWPFSVWVQFWILIRLWKSRHHLYYNIANYKCRNQIYSNFIYLVWTKFTKYCKITLTKLVKILKFSVQNPHAVYSFFIACSWRENILCFLHIRFCSFFLKTTSSL